MSNVKNWHAAKTYFLRMPNKPKNATFLYNNPLNGVTKNTRWWLNKIFNKGPAGHP
jgi:hypothetical protein